MSASARSCDRLRRRARDIWDAGVAAVAPERLMRQAVDCRDGLLRLVDREFALADLDRIVVVGAGKAGPGMASELEAILDDDLLASGRVSGTVNVIDETAGPLRAIHLHPARPAGRPLPTVAGIAGAQAMLAKLGSLGPRDLVIGLLSGGGSALLPLPAAGISLRDKLAVTELMSARGADIIQLNTVRKHLSGIKAGQLAGATAAGHFVTLIISDVVGNPLDMIASGPTVADPTTFADALAALEATVGRAAAPAAVVERLERGAAGALPETPKTLPDTVVNRIIGDNGTAVAAALRRAAALGYSVHDMGSEVTGESWDLGSGLADLATSIRAGAHRLRAPACVVSGGETTVGRVEANGKGGRNQECALAVAERWLAGRPVAAAALLAAGTDGEDGPTDAAGAIVDAAVLASASSKDLAPADFRRLSRSYDFFEATGGLIKTGPTGANVMDLRVLLVDDQ